MATANAKLITAEELLLMPELEYRYELVRGVLTRKPFLEHLIPARVLHRSLSASQSRQSSSRKSRKSISASFRMRLNVGRFTGEWAGTVTFNVRSRVRL